MSLLNTNTVLVLIGLILLVINVIMGVARLREKQMRAGLFSVGLALLACLLVILGITRVSFASNLSSYVAAITAGLPDFSGNYALVAGSVAAGSAGSVGIPPLLVALGGLLIVIASVFSYRLEARQPGFNAGSSSSLLNIGAGALTLVAALVIPVIPFELSHTPVIAGVISPSAGSVSTQMSTPSMTPGPTMTPRPTTTPTASGTPTPLPSLTPTQTETPIVLYTQIAYTSTYAVGLPVGCTITATTALNLRGDPSVKQASIGRVFAGSVLNVIGHSADKKWWYAVNTAGAVQVEGWVSADYVTHNSACDVVPVVDSAGHVISQTPTPDTIPPTPGMIPPTDTSVVSNLVTAAPCTLVATAATNLRSDPSDSQQPIAVIPARTALIANGKSLDGQWWEIAYGSKQGWISAGAVISSSSCPQ